MIVECDRCATRYRVRDDKLPANGGNIKCPSCAHIFFVKPPSAALAPAPALGLRRTSGPLGKDMDKTTGTTPSMLLGSTGAMSSVSTSGMGAATSVDEGPDGWKLKTSFGLVYDFPDTASLLAWLSAREELVGYELAKEDQAFKPLGEYGAILGADIRAKVKGAGQGAGSSGSKAPQSGSGKAVGLDSNVKRSGASSLSSPKPAGGKSPSLMGATPSSPEVKDSGAVAPVPRSVSPVNLQSREVDIPKVRKRVKTDAELKEQQRDQQDTRNIVIFSTIMLLAVMLVVGLQLSGVVNFRDLSGSPPAPEAPPKAGRTVPVVAPV